MAEQQTQDPTSPNFGPVCAIGASAGGITALQALFRQFPTDLGLAYVVILHLAPDQPSALTEILSFCTRMPVFQVEDGPTLKRDCVFVIPPDRELVIDGDSVTAPPFTEPRGRRAPIDLFFRSIAAARGDGIAVVLSGAGADGASGVRAVKEAGGVVMVQEPAEAGFSSMPQNAIATGAADFVAPVARLVERLRDVAHSKEAVRSLDMDGAANDLRRIVAFLRTRTGHDFGSYKRATVMRRVLRRMQVCRLETLSGYADHLYTNPEEAKELFGDLLISVTSFFRDARAFDTLDRYAVKPLLDAVQLEGREGVRGWVVGCASGEEAYSIAMLLMEEMHRRKLFIAIQIFATDLDEGALATAREGRYPRTIEADVSDERLTRFFLDEGTHYRVRRELRETVLFVSHSVLKEPPFMRLDLISCRNLLIYMERSLQQQIYAIFHYGLKSGGCLFLGSAESVDSASDLFASLDREARIYVARPKAVQMLPILPHFTAPERLPVPGQTVVAPLRPEQASLLAVMHATALEQGAPPSALVDDGHNILHLSPTAGRFIFHSGGPISNVLPAVVRPELRLELKFALTRAMEQGLPTLTHPAEVAFDGERRRIALYVVPAQRDERMGRHALVFFLDSGVVAEADRSSVQGEAQPDGVRRLHAELRAAQEALVASRHGHEASIQESRAANEELQSMNEEYRSTAEELETSKEELQSINEELHTVNAEMKIKLESISAAHSDLQNLTAATEVGTLFLDGQLRIRMFTPPVADIFNITAMDVGRPITDFTHQLDYDAIERDARQVLAELVMVEREVMSRGGRWSMMRLRPYRTVEDRIEGTVVTFVDVTARRAVEAALNRSEQQLRALVSASSQVLYRMSPDWREMRELFGGDVLFDTDRPTGGWLETYIPPEEQGRVRAAIRDAVDTQSLFDLEHRVCRADGSVGWVHSRAVGAFAEDGTVTEWFGSASDVTARREAEAALRGSEERFRAMADTAPALIWEMDESGLIFVNGHYLDFLGVGFEDVRGLGWASFLHPDDAEAYRIGYRAAFEERRPYAHEARFRRADGQYRWLRSSGGPVGGRGYVGCSLDVTDPLEAQFALRESEERFAQFAASSSDALWIRHAGTLDMEYASPAVRTIYGVPPESLLDGPVHWTTLIVPEDRDLALYHLEQARAGEAVVHEFRIKRPSDGTIRWIRDTDFPLRDEHGRVQRIGGIARDVTEAKLAAERQAVMVTEIQHRTRNLIAVVRGIADDTMDQTGPTEAFRNAFADRLSALSRVQGLLSRSEVEPITIGTLVWQELDAIGAGTLGERIVVGGHDVFLRPSTVQTLALALHELATNARKYGALSHDQGHLAVTWRERIEGREGRLAIEWIETGLDLAPEQPAEPHQGGGYGRELIENALPHAMGARTSYALTVSGVRCTLDIPVRPGPWRGELP